MKEEIDKDKKNGSQNDRKIERKKITKQKKWVMKGKETRLMKMKEKNERVTSKGMMERKLNEIRMRQQRKLDRIIEEIHERFS